jgi:hypothetical protein
VLNLDRGDLATAPSGLDGRSARRGGGPGGPGGRRGGGGQGPAPIDPRAREEAAARQRALADYVNAATIASKRLTIVVNDASVIITEADGRVQHLPTDNKKIDTRAGNGLIKLFTRNHWDGATLICEFQVELGPRIVRSYSLSPGGTELRLTTQVEGQGQPLSLLRIYERPFDSR